MITKDIYYVGADDRDIDLFEGQYVVPNGIAYNSYVIMDDKIAVMDTVDKRRTKEFFGQLAGSAGRADAGLPSGEPCRTGSCVQYQGSGGCLS